jgi:hypothetical protein
MSRNKAFPILLGIILLAQTLHAANSNGREFTLQNPIFKEAVTKAFD